MVTQREEPKHQQTILVVDDNDSFRHLLARGLHRRGFTVYAADGYSQAMELLRVHCPDRAVVDLKMAGKNGLELIRDALDLCPDLRIVVLTGYGSIATAIEAIRLGACYYLAKPADISEILRAFEREQETRPPGDIDFSPLTLPRIEWEHIQRVLTDCQGNVSQAARKLGIHRRTLQRKLQKYAPPEQETG